MPDCGQEILTGASNVINIPDSAPRRLPEVLNNEEMQSKKDFKEFADLALNGHLVLLPVFSGYNDYSKLINDEAELVVNGKETIDDAVKNIQDQSADMFE